MVTNSANQSVDAYLILKEEITKVNGQLEKQKLAMIWLKTEKRTDEHFKNFASMNATFYPSAPEACFEQLKQILKELGLLGKIKCNSSLV